MDIGHEKKKKNSFKTEWFMCAREEIFNLKLNVLVK